jgi:hypothetical protein
MVHDQRADGLRNVRWVAYREINLQQGTRMYRITEEIMMMEFELEPTLDKRILLEDVDSSIPGASQ